MKQKGVSAKIIEREILDAATPSYNRYNKPARDNKQLVAALSTYFHYASSG